MKNTVQDIVAACLFLQTTIMLSCSSAKPSMAIPETFAEQATMMQVNGNHQGKKPIGFGAYTTSNIQRG
jgi:hypothetical protein